MAAWCQYFFPLFAHQIQAQASAKAYCMPLRAWLLYVQSSSYKVFCHIDAPTFGLFGLLARGPQ